MSKTYIFHNIKWSPYLRLSFPDTAHADALFEVGLYDIL